MRAPLFAAIAALIVAAPLLADVGAQSGAQTSSPKPSAPAAASAPAKNEVAPVAVAEPPPSPAEAAHGIEPAAAMIAGGDLGTLGMPALALPAPHLVTLGLGLDYFRGSDFLLPGATVQRTGLSLGAAYGPLPWLETYGALGFSEANRFGPVSRETLSSIGDADLGIKALVPTRGPVRAGGLLELDIPSGVGGVSMKGTGGRAALMASLSEQLGPLPLVGTALAGYVLDNSYKLLDSIGTFPAYALNLSLYDRAQGELSIQSPMRWAAPVAEFQLEAPVARGQDLPAGPHPVHARLLLGATAIHTGVPGLTASAGLAFSLTGTGRPEANYLPMPGWAPDSPWRAIVAFSYSFEPKLPSRPVWRVESIADKTAVRPGTGGSTRAPLLGQVVGTGAAPAPVATIGAPPIPDGRGRLSLFVVDSHTQLPLPNAWVSAIELSDLGTTTGADGRATLDAPPGALTIAIAHDGYDPFSDSAQVSLGKEREMTIALQPQLTDATVHGKILGEDGKPLRAAIELQPVSGGPQSLGGELEIFEGSYSIAVPHGAFNVIAQTPGYRSDPARVDLLPGEFASRDLTLRRVPGQLIARVSPTRIEVSERLVFTPNTAQLSPASVAMLAEVAKVAKVLESIGPLAVGVRIDPSEVSAGEDELAAMLLAEQRAQAVADVLIANGLSKAQLVAHGFGIAKEGQPLFEIKRGAGKPSL